MAASMVRTRVPGVFARGSRYVAVYLDPDRVQRKKSFRTQKEAESFKKAQEVAVEQGTYQPDTKTTVAEFADRWLAQARGLNGERWRANTKTSHEQHSRLYIKKRLGNLKLTALNRSTIKAFYLKLETDGIGYGAIGQTAQAPCAPCSRQRWTTSS
jgi:hypothetical protein